MAQSISESAENHEVMSFIVRSKISCFLIKTKLNGKKIELSEKAD